MSVEEGQELLQKLVEVVSRLETGISHDSFWEEVLKWGVHLEVLGAAKGAAPVKPSAHELASGSGQRTIRDTTQTRLRTLLEKARGWNDAATKARVVAKTDPLGYVKRCAKQAADGIRHWETETWKAGYLPPELKDELQKLDNFAR
jgi:hypothetical protein